MNNNVCEIYPAITKYKSSAIKEGETIAPTKNPNPESKATKAPNNPILAKPNVNTAPNIK